MTPPHTSPAPVDAEVTLRQAERLADDIRVHTSAFDDQARALADTARLADVESVVLVGDGDSDHAARAVEMAYRSLAGVDCRPVSALPFAHYWRPAARSAARVLTIAVSASGRTPPVVRAAEQARADGTTVVALTGDATSPLARAAHGTVHLALPDQEPSPGIRTYQASLLGALLLATALGTARGHLTGADADLLRSELRALAGPVEATVSEAVTRTRLLAGRIADAPVLTVLGSGPSHGTALHAAAKVIETSGVFAVGRDVEEWCHVERFAGPRDLPVLVVAPPGRSLADARRVARRATELGRRIIAVAARDDLGSFDTREVLPVHGRTREEFSPLLHGLFAAPLAYHLAQTLHRTPFAAGRP
ncbi:SIS domain-containing protein [Streptomyces halstedii]|uniref:SIS domain-containing protein n=1 Tax=Streptomyces halstedii TaxID=1944 RepID=UPI003460338B